MPHTVPHHVTIIGGGPAGLMAAEVLSQAGVYVDLYDGMPSVGRKFLLAGVGGMNITHSEAYPAFVSRYAERAPQMAPLLRGFGAQALCEWIQGLGIETFVGTSGRVFPTDMKAAPLLRAWAPTEPGLTCWKTKACPTCACNRATAASKCRPGAT